MNNSLKEKIRHWFEFLRLAHDSPDRVVGTNLRASEGFYLPWGDYRGTKFNDWWKSHSTLFRDKEVLSILKVGDLVSDESFHIRIPYTYAPSTIGRIVSEMYDRELTKRGTRTKKMRKVYGGTFSLSRDDYQVAQFYYYFIFVRDVYLPLRKLEPRAKTSRYIEMSQEVFNKVKRKTTEKRDIPFTNPDLTYDSASRLVRRYRQMAEKLLRNVSKGEFPGDYEETFIKNQSQIRAERATKAPVIAADKRLRGRPSSMDRVVTKGVNAADPYSGSKRKTRSDKGVKREKYATR
jgi:hypothetical protein